MPAASGPQGFPINVEEVYTPTGPEESRTWTVQMRVYVGPDVNPDLLVYETEELAWDPNTNENYQIALDDAVGTVAGRLAALLST